MKCIFFFLEVLKYSSKNVKAFFERIDLVSVPRVCLAVSEARDSSASEHTEVLKAGVQTCSALKMCLLTLSSWKCFERFFQFLCSSSFGVTACL